MTTAAFLDQVKRLGVELAANGDRLRCSAPAGVLTPQLRVEIEKRKPEILAALAQERGAPPAAPPRAIPRLPREGALALSFAQRRLWFLQELAPDSTAYTISGAVLLRGPLDEGALGAALSGVLRGCP